MNRNPTVGNADTSPDGTAFAEAHGSATFAALQSILTKHEKRVKELKRLLRQAVGQRNTVRDVMAQLRGESQNVRMSDCGQKPQPEK